MYERVVVLSLVACVALAGCEGCGGAGSEESATSAPAEGSSGGSSSEPEATRGQEPTGPPPTLSIRGETDRYGRIQPVVENRDDRNVELAGALSLQRQADAEWRTAGAGELGLRDDCQAPAPECRSLIGGAALLPPVVESDGQGQCGCEGCDALEAGTYRFVVKTCDGRDVRGTPFTLRR